MSDQMNLELLIKLLKMTTSSSDGEALVAMRKANETVARFTDWETLLRGKITIVEDPFNTAAAPLRRQSTQKPPAPAAPRAKQPSRPAPKPQWSNPAPQPRPKPTPPPQPAKPSLPPQSFSKNANGDWVLRSAVALTPGQFIDVPTKKGNISSVIIDSAIGTNNFGDYLYSYHYPKTPRDLGGLA